MYLNKVILIGRLAQDPESRVTPSGQNVANFTIVTNRYYQDKGGDRQEATEFHKVVAWGRIAEIASQYLQKGNLVMIEGRLQTRSWEGQDGIKRYVTEIIAEKIQLGPKGQSTTPADTPAPKNENIDEPVDIADIQIDESNEEDVPF